MDLLALYCKIQLHNNSKNKRNKNKRQKYISTNNYKDTLQSLAIAWFLRHGHTTSYTQIQSLVDLDAALGICQWQLCFHFSIQNQNRISNKEENSDCPSGPLDLKNRYMTNMTVLEKIIKRTSPHGNLFVKSMPVMGVPVGGSNIALSMHSHSTFKDPLDISQYL